MRLSMPSHCWGGAVRAGPMRCGNRTRGRANVDGEERTWPSPRSSARGWRLSCLSRGQVWLSTAASSPLEPMAARTSCPPPVRFPVSTRRPSQRWCARGVRDAAAHSEEPGCLGASCSGGPSEPLAWLASVVTCVCGSGPSSSPTIRLSTPGSEPTAHLTSLGICLSFLGLHWAAHPSAPQVDRPRPNCATASEVGGYAPCDEGRPERGPTRASVNGHEP